MTNQAFCHISLPCAQTPILYRELLPNPENVTFLAPDQRARSGNLVRLFDEKLKG